MHLTLILGPMKSGKSLDLISYFSPLEYSNESFGLYNSALNIRDENLESRNGVFLKSKKIKSLKEINETDLKHIGIDEIHMFEEDDAAVIKEFLKAGTRVIVSGLDMDYKGELFPIIKKLLELGPREVRYRRAACEHCKNLDAVYTQVYLNDKIIKDNFPSVIPEDGKFIYRPVCRRCFVN